MYGYDPHSTSFGPEVHGHSRMKSRSFFCEEWYIPALISVLLTRRCIVPYEIGNRDDHTAQPPMWTLRQLMKAHGTSPGEHGFQGFSPSQKLMP